MPSGIEYLLVGLAAVAAGAVNALAGGGTLITFPTLTAVGIPAVAASITNTVALCPGYLGATLAQAGDLHGQRRRLWLVLPAAALGGIVGGLLLLNSGERLFRALVPFLILLASGLLAVQEPLRAWLVRRVHQADPPGVGELSTPDASTTHSPGARTVPETWASLPVGLACIYGGYFGAGLSVITLAVLGLTLDDSLTRLNALKQAVALSANVAAAIVFVFSGEPVWPIVAVMAVGSLLGGVLGGRLAGRVQPATLRRVVVVIGVVVAVIYLVR